MTVTFIAEVDDGAVKRPVFEMVPAEADQLTAVFVEPPMVAVNCSVPPEETVALVGAIDTETAVGAAVAEIVQEAVAVWLLLSYTVRIEV